MPLPPFTAKLLRFALVGFGAAAVMSAIVNIVGAYRLIDGAEEQMLGVSRGEFIAP
jgi:hypothetical protein